MAGVGGALSRKGEGSYDSRYLEPGDQVVRFATVENIVAVTVAGGNSRQLVPPLLLLLLLLPFSSQVLAPSQNVLERRRESTDSEKVRTPLFSCPATDDFSRASRATFGSFSNTHVTRTKISSLFFFIYRAVLCSLPLNKHEVNHHPCCHLHLCLCRERWNFFFSLVSREVSRKEKR